MRSVFLVSLLMFGVAGSAGCDSSKPNPPQLEAYRIQSPGVLEQEIALPRTDGSTEHLWIYLPVASHTAKIPCILIAPAGSPLVYGMNLGDGDRPEHLPYVHAGYAVVAYSLSGPLADASSVLQIIKAAQEFRKADAGAADAKIALNYALAHVPQIDSKRIYTAGHSSAGTVALLVAESDPRIAACIAYAPCCNVPGRLGPEMLQSLDSAIPGEADFLAKYSPDARLITLSCPVFLFHADDDANVPAKEVEAFFDKVQQTNLHVTYSHVKSGGHYESMLHDGIPQAISWLGSLPAKS
jgi:dipeptidyl aminopeptidase/acylaminoacyl peptidase